MSNYGPESAEGRIERICVQCGATFRTNWPRQKYCSNACKRRAQNARHYQQHRKKIIARVLKNQKGD